MHIDKNQPTCLKEQDSQESLLSHLTQAITASGTNNRLGAFLTLSVENLAMLISSYTADFIDTLLHQVKEEITRCVGENGQVMHLQQDQFSIILYRHSGKAIDEMADTIYHALQHFNCSMEHSPVYITVAIGGVDFPLEGNSARETIDRAYMALCNARQQTGTYYCHYNDAKKNYSESKDTMVQASYLQNAILRNTLRLAYQPIISSTTGKVLCYECLLRIVEEDGTIKSAGPYIPVAEHMGFINEIDHIVLQKVVEELRASPDVTLGFNISSQTIDTPHWLKKAEKLLKDPAISSRVIIEITETGIQKDLRRVAYFVASLQGLGCQVALDDFGAGYTSFRQLKALPVDIIKIDGSFIKDMIDNSENRLFVKTLLNFTNSFGLKTIAEYVETGEIAKSLMDLKVDYMQGHYFSPAVNHRPWVVQDKALLM